MNAKGWLHGAGYASILVPPVLLAGSVAARVPWLPFVALIVVAPLLRLLLGDAPRQPPWSERAASWLEVLPAVAAVAFLLSFGYSAWAIGSQALKPWGWVQYGLSLWAVGIFSSCYAHELLHRPRAPWSNMLGRLVSGAMGYPLLEHEHREHHLQGARAVELDWAPVEESVWHYSRRRLVRAAYDAWEGDRLAADLKGHRLRGGLAMAASATLLMAGLFAASAGAAGLALYAAVAFSVAWTLQAMTYVQHWGLGPNAAHDAGDGHYAWEDGCRLQAWLTLCISYHQGHHLRPSLPYYRREMAPDSPRQPAGYVVLLFASMIPPLWRALMLPALRAWQDKPTQQQHTGRRLICFKR